MTDQAVRERAAQLELLNGLSLGRLGRSDEELSIYEQSDREVRRFA
jgi:hypothetical protein